MTTLRNTLLEIFALEPQAYWSYEKASVMSAIVHVPYDSPEHEEVEAFVRALHEELRPGQMLDNKIVIGCLDCSGNKLYVGWHDANLSVGTGIRPYRFSGGPEIPEPTYRRES